MPCLCLACTQVSTMPSLSGRTYMNLAKGPTDEAAISHRRALTARCLSCLAVCVTRQSHHRRPLLLCLVVGVMSPAAVFPQQSLECQVYFMSTCWSPSAFSVTHRVKYYNRQLRDCSLIVISEKLITLKYAACLVNGCTVSVLNRSSPALCFRYSCISRIEMDAQVEGFSMVLCCSSA